ncbi:FAD-binding oxidoreductase [Acrocarpospora macrocephala]|nr:FAD-binding oxidoreductase [Acrocarpospora macrocephala]
MTLNDLRQTIKGRVVLRGDECFDEARKPWNRAIDQWVLAVVEAYDADDVATLVTYARQERLTVAAQRAGHRPSGDVDGVILLRTDRLNDVAVDPVTRTARVGAGATWGQVLAAASPHGLTGLVCSSATVGALGAVLSGGVGWFGRKYGFAANTVRAFDAVDADGLPVRVTPETDPDLFWALRGGGGDFAVVTAMEFDLPPAPKLYGGRMLWAADRASYVLDAYREVTATAPEDLAVWFNLFQPPDAAPSVAVDVTFLGEAGEAQRLLSRLEAVEGVISDNRGVMPVEELGGICAEPIEPSPGLWRSELLTVLDDTVAQLLLANAKSMEPLTSLQLRQLGGAVAVDRPDGGVVPPLIEPFLLSMFGVPSDPEARIAVEAKMAEMAGAFEGYVSGTKPYMCLAPGEDASKAFPEATLLRLRELKRSRDPHNVFRGNFPILR